MPTVYAATDDALLVATGAGDDWAATEALADAPTGRLQAVAASPDAPERVLVGTFEAGLQRSTDGGETFERVGGAIESDAVTAVAVGPHDPEEVWAGTEPSAVYRSTDGGASWEAVGGLTDLPSAGMWSFPPRPHTHHVRWLEPSPHDPGRLYVAVEAGAFVYTDDGGATWHGRPPGSRRDVHTLATHPDAPGRVYAAAGDGYAESTDGGESWTHPQAGLDHRYVWSVAVDPADPDAVVVSAASGAHRAHGSPGEAYLYRRAGDRWERLDREVPTGEGARRAVLTAGREAGELYACNDHGLYRTADAGDSWARLPVEWPDRFHEGNCRGLAVV